MKIISKFDSLVDSDGLAKITVTENAKILKRTIVTFERNLRIMNIVYKVLSFLLVLIIAIFIFCYGAMLIIIKGPSKSAGDIFVISCMETSFAKYFPPLFLSDAEINEIKESNTVIQSDDVTTTHTEFTKPIEVPESKEQPDIEVVPVSGGTFKGVMMIVKDPSRVSLCTPKAFGEGMTGNKLDEMIKAAGAVAGINGGGFVDESGIGSGGVPVGIVIKDGKFIYGEGGGLTNIVGFDKNNVLVAGNMTPTQMKARNIRDAVSFGPALIINKVPTKVVGGSGGLNPRTAIGQRGDGSVLLLVIDGRQPHSLGASYKDLIEVMLEHGAENAGNLDGGSSSMIYYNGELINTCASLYGPRKIPTGFIVK